MKLVDCRRSLELLWGKCHLNYHCELKVASCWRVCGLFSEVMLPDSKWWSDSNSLTADNSICYSKMRGLWGSDTRSIQGTAHGMQWTRNSVTWHRAVPQNVECVEAIKLQLHSSEIFLCNTGGGIYKHMLYFYMLMICLITSREGHRWFIRIHSELKGYTIK